ncbi:MarR family winged helix-turn-helix transcriptional regulator [Nocardioides lentus]|uniref:MarR family winged helix-turn-helix transcriptional regulator n=1 Tax=Nocardioides lentus TaxID=338077 RepID=UPI0031D65FE2
MADDGWLSTEEIATWRAVDALVRRLPAALETQLTRDSGLSLTEYYVLAGLADQPGHSVRMSRLAELAHCELSRLSHLVKRLERRGWARREPDREDRRYTRAVLTEAGHAHLVAAAPAHVARVRRVLLEALTVAEQTALREAASAVVGRLDDLGV